MSPAVMIALILIYPLLKHKQTSTYAGQEITAAVQEDQMLETLAGVCEFCVKQCVPGM